MKIGFIGGGNMGGAIIGGIINAGIADKSDIIVSDKNEAALENINKKYGVCTDKDNKNTAQRSDKAAVPFFRDGRDKGQYQGRLGNSIDRRGTITLRARRGAGSG